MILNICDNPDVLKVMRIVDIVITIIKIVAPILLIISCMLDYMNAVKDNDSDALIKTNRLVVKRVIAAVLIFFIPTFVKLIAKIADNDMQYASCITAANAEGISAAYENRVNTYLSRFKKSLTEADYNALIREINNISDESVRIRHLNEAEALKKYIELNEKVKFIRNKPGTDDYNNVLNEINSVSDTEVKETLLSTLEGKDSSTPTTPYQKTDVVEESTTKRYHINGHNKLKFYMYNQCEGNWKDVKLRNGETDFCAIGCGLTTQTVLISAYSPNVTPYNSLVWGNDSMHDQVIMTQTNNAFTCKKYSKSEINAEQIKTYLNTGYVASLKVWGSSNGYYSPFTSSQHFMALIDYTDNEIFVGNAYDNSLTYGKWGWFKADDVLKGFQEVVLCKPKSLNEGGGGNDGGGSLNLTSSFKKYTDTTYSPLGGYYLYIPPNATENMPLIVAFPPNSNAAENVKAAIEQKISNLKAFIYIPTIAASTHTDWSPSASTAAVKKIQDLVKEYKLNDKKISLTAFSSSGWYIYWTANEYRIFSSIAPISSGMTIDTIKNYKDWEYLKSLPMKGYGEKGGATTESGRSCSSVGTVQWSAKYAMCSAFEGLGKCSDCNNCSNFTYLPEVCHGEITKYVFNIDSNNNNVADILEWMISQTK